MQCNSQTSLNKIHFLNTLYHFCLNTISWFSQCNMIWCQMWMSGFLICIFRYVAFTTDFRTGSLIILYLCCCQEIIFSPLPHGMCYSHCQIPGVLWHPQYPRYLPPWAYCSIYCCFITEIIAKDKIQCHRLWQDHHTFLHGNMHENSYKKNQRFIS